MSLFALSEPTLLTERLRLRPFRDDDAHALFALQSDAHVLRYWDSSPWTHRDRARDFIERCHRLAQDGTGMRLAVERREDGAFLGWCSLTAWNPDFRSASMGFCYVEQSWGHGHATEAAAALMRWGWQAWDLNRVQAEADTRNVGCAKVLEKVGFTREGTLRQDCVVDGVVSDSWVYGLLREDWESPRPVVTAHNDARMPFPQVVETAHLTLRPPTQADREVWVRLHRDPRTFWHAPHAMAQSDGEAAEFFDSSLEHWDELGFGFWLAQDRASGEVVGVCGLKQLSGERGTFLNLYYRLMHDSLGRGLGREMSRAGVAHALEFLPDLPVWALVKEVNVPSVRTALASGLERGVGTRVLSDDLPDEPPSTIFAAPRVESVRALDAATREQVLDLWMRTNDAGGAVGFLPGASRERVDAALTRHEESMAADASTGVLLRSAADDRVLALAFLEPVGTPLMPHVAAVGRVMTEPTARGRNLGRLLMAGVHRVARESGIQILTLGVRSGTGTSGFYEACGYEESGRILGAIRVAPGDERDDITMSRRLDDQTRKPDRRN